MHSDVCCSTQIALWLVAERPELFYKEQVSTAILSSFNV